MPRPPFYMKKFKRGGIFILLIVFGSIVMNNINVTSIEMIDNSSFLGFKQNLMFIKTHKTGSSTLGSVFYLYGIKRKLIFLHPPNVEKQGVVGEEYFRQLLPPRVGQSWDMQVKHCKFNAEFQHQVLPKNVTFYTTVIRSPVSHFKSAFVFFGHFDRLRTP